MFKDFLMIVGILMALIVVVVGVTMCSGRVSEQSCINLADEINRPTVYMDSECWVEVCPGVRLPVYDIEYHIDLIQSCAQEDAQ